MLSGPIPDNLRNCVNKDYFPATPIQPPVQQWDIDSRNPSIPPTVISSHQDVNGRGYRYPVPQMQLSQINPLGGSELMGPESILPGIRGPPAPATMSLLSNSHQGRPSSASPVVVSRQSPSGFGGKSDGEVAYKDERM